jgi:hypothetical protein
LDPRADPQQTAESARLTAAALVGAFLSTIGTSVIGSSAIATSVIGTSAAGATTTTGNGYVTLTWGNGTTETFSYTGAAHPVLGVPRWADEHNPRKPGPSSRWLQRWR